MVDAEVKSQQFAVKRAILYFCGFKLFAEKSEWTPIAVDLLFEDAADCKIQCVAC